MDSDAFEIFDLTVLQPDRAGVPWVSAHSDAGSVHAVPRLDWPADRLQTLLDQDSRWFRDAIVQGRVGSDSRLYDFGSALRDLVFGDGEVVKLLQRTRGAAAAGNRPVLIRLLATPEHVSSLPWELMIDPDDARGTPLVLDSMTHLVRLARWRRYPSRRALVPPPAPPLNMLLVLSNPRPAGDSYDDDELPFDHYEEGRALLEAVAPLIEAGSLNVEIERRPSVENLRRRFDQKQSPFHIVHFVGHARPGALKLEDAAGRARWVPSGQVNRLLRDAGDLRLLVLAGCRTSNIPAEPVEHDVIALSVADLCVRDACPNVIGMQEALPFHTERVFSDRLYQSLCNGSTIAGAMSSARNAVSDDLTLGAGQITWAVPILVTAHEPAGLLDLTKELRPPPPPKRHARLDLLNAGTDLKFFARFSELQTAVAVLERKDPDRRILWLTGPAGSGKSRLMKRALEEIRDDVDVVLALPSSHLDEPDSDTRTDPVKKLLEHFIELLEKAGPKPDQSSGLSLQKTWAQLSDQIGEMRCVIAIDDVDRLSRESAQDLGRALAELVTRAKRARVAVSSAHTMPRELVPEHHLHWVADVHVPHLSAGDVVGWVRRNHPALGAALTTSPADLTTVYNKLGPRLTLWSDLADVYREQTVRDLDAAVSSIVAESAEAARIPEPRNGGPVRLAVVPPLTSGHLGRFARALTEFALLEHQIPMRIVMSGDGDPTTCAAVVLDMSALPGSDHARTLPHWLTLASAAQADITVVRPSRAPGADDRRGADSDEAPPPSGSANEGLVIVPVEGDGHVPEVPLAKGGRLIVVGSLSATGRPVPTFDTDLGQPHVYAPSVAGDSALSALLPDVDLDSIPGPEFAALHIVAAALLVWSLDRTLTSEEVSNAIVDSAEDLADTAGGRKLDMWSAIRRVRERLVLDRLKVERRRPSDLALSTGMPEPLIEKVVDALVAQGAVSRNADGFVDGT